MKKVALLIFILVLAFSLVACQSRVIDDIVDDVDDNNDEAIDDNNGEDNNGEDSNGIDDDNDIDNGDNGDEINDDYHFLDDAQTDIGGIFYVDKLEQYTALEISDRILDIANEYDLRFYKTTDDNVQLQIILNEEKIFDTGLKKYDKSIDINELEDYETDEGHMIISGFRYYEQEHPVFTKVFEIEVEIIYYNND